MPHHSEKSSLGLLHPIPDLLSSRKLQISKTAYLDATLLLIPDRAVWPLFAWTQSYTDIFLETQCPTPKKAQLIFYMCELSSNHNYL